MGSLKEFSLKTRILSKAFRLLEAEKSCMELFVMHSSLGNSIFYHRCFGSLNSEATILNLLIENSLGRMRNFNMNLNKDNKDSTYQKLQIFK